jgi:mannose-6-phosphate isomerase
MLRFKPQYKPALWGGRRMAEELGRTLPEGPIGESWELVELDGQESIVGRGSLEGKKLGDLWRKSALGGSAKGPFPFLLKWLDTSQRLSVQVHPDEQNAVKLGGKPKTEAWFVAANDPKATILLGHYPGLDAATLRTAAAGGTIQKWLYETRPRAGDMLLVPAGTLHSIGAGFLLLEVQQPSDSTYRVYDWGRVDANGAERPLHVDQACEAVAYNRYGPPKLQRQRLRGPCFQMQQCALGVGVAPEKLRVFVADGGPAVLSYGGKQKETMELGDVVVAEPSDGPVALATGTALLITEPSDD